MSFRVVVGAALVLLSGCSEDRPFTAPEIRLDKVAASGCYIVCPEHPPVFEGSPVLGTVCSAEETTAQCGFAGATDRIRVVMDLDGLVIDRQLPLITPEVQMLLDGVSTPVNGVLDRSESIERTYFAVTFPAPAKRVTDLSLRAKIGDGFFAEASGFTVDGPVVTLTVAGCDEVSCVQEAGVGAIVAEVSGPVGLLGREAIVDSELDAIPTDRTDRKLLVGAAENQASTKVKIPVPDFGELWTIQAQVDGFFATPINIDLTPTSLAVDIQDCPADDARCTLAAESTATIVVEAPRDIHTTAATLVPSLDGVLTGESFPMSLGTLAEGRRSGSVKLAVPSFPGKSWKLRAFVGEASIDSVSVTILPKTGL